MKITWSDREKGELRKLCNGGLTPQEAYMVVASEKIEQLQGALQRIKDHGPSGTSAYCYGVAFAALESKQ